MDLVNNEEDLSVKGSIYLQNLLTILVKVRGGNTSIFITLILGLFLNKNRNRLQGILESFRDIV